nr:hypothetical protein [Ancylobacter sp. Lp-2]
MLSATYVLVLAGLSLAANARLHDQWRLPMQWSLSGRVNWSAPRPLALAFTPTLAAIVLCALTIALKEHPEGLPALAATTLAFIGAHLLHLFLIVRRGR